MFVRLYHATYRHPLGEVIATLYLLDGQIQVEAAQDQMQRMAKFLREEIGWFRKGRPIVPITAASHPQAFLEKPPLGISRQSLVGDAAPDRLRAGQFPAPPQPNDTHDNSAKSHAR